MTLPCGPAADLPGAEFVRRAKRLRARLTQERVGAALVVSDVNRYYLTGLETSNGALLLQRTQPPVFYTDFRYLAMARRSLDFMAAREIWRPSDEPKALAALGRTWRRVGYEGNMPAQRFLRLKEALPQVEWVDIGPLLDAMRAVKSEAEQRVLRTAMAANDRVYEAVMRQVVPGMREWEIRTLVRREADLLGQGEAFDTIACVGRNAAECHHHPGQTVLRSGQTLLLDFGVRRDRYCSDMTRSVCFGAPTPLYRNVHAVVLEANRLAIRAIRPGRRCDEIDAVARKHIARAGFDDFFGHGLGHSLGLEIHESPSFSPNCTTVIEPGMVLTVEPGIYLPGRLGVRIEDVILVTADGCEVLSHSPRGLSPA